MRPILRPTLLALALLTMAVSSPVVIAIAEPTSAQAASPTMLPVFGPGKDYHPVIDPANFTKNVDNPFFPLPPGRTMIYSGSKDGKKAVNVVVVTSRTKVVDGVRCRIVEDRLFLNGTLEERTADYYAQDEQGNVWYFGEDTAQLDAQGRVVSTDGSFHAGVDGAQPGVFMQAQPELRRKFRQEWYEGHAEDQFKVLDFTAPIEVPYGSWNSALRTQETTSLEPGVVDNKYFVAGIGEVKEIAVKGGTEALFLVDVIDS